MKRWKKEISNWKDIKRLSKAMVNQDEHVFHDTTQNLI